MNEFHSLRVRAYLLTVVAFHLVGIAYPTKADPNESTADSWQFAISVAGGGGSDDTSLERYENKCSLFPAIWAYYLPLLLLGR